MDWIKREVAKAASELLDDFGDWTLPINPVALANHLGVNFEMETFEGDIVSDVVSTDEESTITVASSSSFEEARFLIAYELGKFVVLTQTLWEEEGTDEFYSHTHADSFELDDYGAFAFAFALELLMPEDMFLNSWDEAPAESETTGLADLFGVDEALIRWQLARLAES